MKTVFFKKNASMILTCVGAVGVVATAVSAAKATPKAMYILEEACDYGGLDLKKSTKFKIVFPIYIPTVMIGASTIACIFGSTIIDKNKQAALIGAYSLLEQAFDEYKTKVKELYGADADDKVQKAIIEEGRKELTVSEDKVLFYDEMSRRYFESDMDTVIEAETDVNKFLALRGYINMDVFYKKIGLEIEDAIYCPDVYSVTDKKWVEFNHKLVVMDDGLECYIITTEFEPTHFICKITDHEQ